MYAESTQRIVRPAHAVAQPYYLRHTPVPVEVPRVHAPPAGRVSPLAVIVLLSFLVAIAGAVGYRAKRQRQGGAERSAAVSAARRVLVVHPTKATGNVELTVPGTVRSDESATLTAKAQGFVRVMKVNIGDHVKKGALLAVIDVPELADQLELARAKRRETEANVGLVKKRHERASAMLKEGLVSAQDSDEAEAQYNSAVASVSSARAEARRLETMSRYLRVVAPYDGTITRRYVDPGAVVNAGATALFDLGTTDALKVVVEVPQSVVAGAGAPPTAEITARSSGAKTTVTLLRSAGALDEVTRTMRVEFAIPAAAAAASFLPGAYVDVRLSVPRPAGVEVVPSAALCVDASGTRVVTTGPDGSAHFTKVAIVRDLGRDVEVTPPLDPAASVVLFPPVDVVEGERLAPVARAP